MTRKLKTGIIGASGYTGAELVRLLHGHPNVEITALIANSSAGQPIGAIYPHLKLFDLPDLVKVDAVDFKKIDVAFGCLPHGESQEMLAKLHKQHKKLVIIDLSADYRIKNPAEYARWYGHTHVAPELQKEAVYALTEHYTKEVKKARLIANPGCYPTSILMPLLPLLKEKLISAEGIIADSKSGITGAGRGAKVDNLFAEANEDTRPYGIAGHRHLAEVEQELSIAAKTDVKITFTPHVVPMNRGIVSVIYVNTKTSAEKLKATLQAAYKDSPFVHVLKDKTVPTARMVRGTNHVAINVFDDRIAGRAIIVSVIDNLVKGASGQAIQNMNVHFGFAETLGLDSVAAAF